MPSKPGIFSLPSPEEQTELKAIVIKIPVQLHRRLMNVCQNGGVTMQDTVSKMIEYCLSQVEGGDSE